MQKVLGKEVVMPIRKRKKPEQPTSQSVLKGLDEAKKIAEEALSEVKKIRFLNEKEKEKLK